jgi:hypothetical protein
MCVVAGDATSSGERRKYCECVQHRRPQGLSRLVRKGFILNYRNDDIWNRRATGYTYFSLSFLGSLAYKLSKAALDQLTRCTALEVQNKVSSFKEMFEFSIENQKRRSTQFCRIKYWSTFRRTRTTMYNRTVNPKINVFLQIHQSMVKLAYTSNLYTCNNHNYWSKSSFHFFP